MATISMEALMLHLMHKAERSRSDFNNKNKSMLAEVRTLEFWRAIIAECMASFFYVVLACGAHVPWPHYPTPSIIIKALASGIGMAAVAQCFGHVSGAHANPACTLAMLVTRKISPLRSFLYVTSQCGGAIAGAALLYGLTASGTTHSNYSIGLTEVHESLGLWQAACLELVLTFVVVFTVYAASDPNRRSLGSESIAVGIAYLACSVVALPATGASMNPARTLGPAFVINKWNNHWVYWCGPVCGGLLAGLIYDYIFDNDKRIIPYLKNDDEDDQDKRSHHGKEEEEDESDSKSAKSVEPFPRIRLTQRPSIYEQQQPLTMTRLHRPAGPYSRAGSMQAVENVAGSHQVSAAGYTYPEFYSSLPRSAMQRTWIGTNPSKF